MSQSLKEVSTRQLEILYEQSNSDPQLLQALLLELAQRPSQQAQALLAEIQVQTYRLEQGIRNDSIDWDEVIATQARLASEREAHLAAAAEHAKEPVQRALAALDAWMVVETLTPQVVKLPENLAQRGSFVPLSQNVPWGEGALAQSMAALGQNQSVYYQVYLGDIKAQDAQAELLELYSDHAEIKGVSGQIMLAVITVNQQGVLVGEFGVGVACFGWSFGRARMKKIQHLPFWHSAERLLIRKLRQRLSPVDEEQRPKSLTYEDLQAARVWLTENLDLEEDTVQPVRFAVRIVQPAKKRPPSSPLLNSFLLADLWRAKESLLKNRASPALLQYLQIHAPIIPDHHSQTDLMDTLQYTLDSQQLPLCRWPSDFNQSLDGLQQTAVSIALQKQNALFSVHGPPGTGKTTLLRDIVAGVIHQRAEALATFETPGTAFGPKVPIKLGDQRYDIYPLDASLLGHEIIVCSRNNKAVENISLELPRRGEINSNCDGLDYFSETMQNYWHEKNARPDTAPADPEPVQTELFATLATFEANAAAADEPWGLIAAALGNARNRQAYARGVWLDPAHGFKYYFEQIMAAWKLTADQPELDDAACLAHLNAADLKQHFMTEQLELSEAQTLHRWQLARANYYAKQQAVETSLASCNLVAGDASQAYSISLPTVLQTARDDLFIAIMALYKAFIFAAAPQLYNNMSAYVRVLLGARGSRPDLLPHLWSAGALLTPVVSTTFASVQRMLNDLPEASIGWLLIDEAGQASPQDAIGAINRAQQVVVVGDPQQIEPVVTLPAGLVAGIAAYHGLDVLSWMAPDSSVQSLADRGNPYSVRLDACSPELSGWPMLVHRRCDEPMFGIINSIAYQNRMVQGQAQSDSRARLPSQWLHVQGQSIDKWCAAEGEVAVELVERLLQESAASVFIVSPFRSCVIGLRQVFRQHKHNPALRRLQNVSQWVRRDIGTVHTFQGRQAARVILVLGAQGESEQAARHWATQQVNLINVAVSRAQCQFFVIGHKGLWSNLGPMSMVAAGLEY